MTDGLSIIIPVLNEEDILEANTARLVTFLESLSRPFELILVSNGSRDRTDTLGRNLSHNPGPIRFFSLPEKGVGRAFVLAVKEARFDRIVSLDMDLSIDLDFIPRADRLLDQWDIVVGSKKMGAQKRSLVRKAGSAVFILTARFLLGLSFKDYSIAAKAYRTQVVLQNLDRIDAGTSYVLDILYYSLTQGGRAMEIPVFCEDYRASRFNLGREAVYRFRNLFGLWWRTRGGRM